MEENIQFNKDLSLLELYVDQNLVKTEVDYVHVVSDFTSKVESYRPKRILAMINKPVENYDNKMGAWVNQAIIQFFNTNGIEKVAFCFLNSEKEFIMPEFINSIEFDFEVFTQEKPAREWIEK